MRLCVGGVEVAGYVEDPYLDVRLGPRPYLHPVRTLGGIEVTETVPRDHPWHLGVSVAMQDVNGANLWGGRTYVRGHGYQWREDHGRIVHAGWLPPDGGAPEGGSAFGERLHWLDPSGVPMLTEERTVAAAPAAGGWQLSFAYRLSAPDGLDVTLGSPATNGRPDGAGYGGFFWRAPMTTGRLLAFGPAGAGTELLHGSTSPWLALACERPDGGSWTLVFVGACGDTRQDPWFVRTRDYAGVGSALAWHRPLTIGPGRTVSRRVVTVVTDGVQDPERAATLASAVYPA